MTKSFRGTLNLQVRGFQRNVLFLAVLTSQIIGQTQRLRMSQHVKLESKEYSPVTQKGDSRLQTKKESPTVWNENGIQAAFQNVNEA